MSNWYFKKKLILLLVSFSVFGFFTTTWAYDFESGSGISQTAVEAGYNEANLTEDTIAQLTGRIIRTVILYIGVFFLLLTIYAGFIWMFSRGNEQQIEKAKLILQNAIIGLIVVLLAYAITYLFMAALSGVQGEVPELIEI